MLNLSHRSSRYAGVAVAALAAIFCGAPAKAAVWTESTDTGDLPGTAQVTTGPAGEPLTTISGTIDATSDTDLYQILIPDPGAFSASTVGGDTGFGFDAVLALFDANGFGVYLNDDAAVNLGDSALPAAHPLGPSSPGIYYIAIFSDETIPVSGAGISLDDLIFPFPQDPFTEVVGPTGGGGGAPVSGWPTNQIFVLGAGYQINLLGAQAAASSPLAGPLVAAVLPASRSVQVGNTATAFATIINAGSVAATGCGIAAPTGVPADFSYQTTDAANALTGTANTPVDIGAGGNQSYVFAFTPTAPVTPTDVQLSFDCTDTDPASVIVGLNTLLLVADSGPVPDIVALAATTTNDGRVNVPSPGAFSVATVNVGVAGTISVSADTGNVSLPVSIALCETDPATGVCTNPPAPTAGPVTTSIAANATPTFAIFVTGTDTVPDDPANNRIFVRFQDAGGVTRGATSVAVRTVP